VNLPNKLTIFRIALTFVFILLILKEGLMSKIFATLIFSLASFTDFLDGYFAKKYDLTSSFGKIMDPIADKFLMLSAFFIFMRLGVVAAWMVIIIFVREILITAIRLYAIRKGAILAAENMGKYKTVAQICVVIVILVFLIFKETSFALNWSDTVWALWHWNIMILMSAVVLLTLISGVSFLKNNRSLLRV